MSARKCPECCAALGDGTERCPTCDAVLTGRPVARPVGASPSQQADQPTDEPVADALPATFAVSPYRATSGSSVVGLFVTFVVGMIAAVVMGVIASAIGQLFYLIVIFPVAIGLVVGVSMSLAAKFSKMHSLAAGGLIGFLCGVVAMLVVHFCDYQWASAAGLPPNVSFPEFMDLQATAGVRIGRGGGHNLGYTGSFIYWGIEMLVVAGIVFFLGLSQASSPFCVKCNDWKTERILGPYGVAPGEAKAYVEAGDVVHLGLVRDNGPRDSTLRLIVAVCPHCGAEGSVDVRLQQVVKTKEGETTSNLCHTTYPGHSLASIDAIPVQDAEEVAARKKRLRRED